MQYIDCNVGVLRRPLLSRLLKRRIRQCYIDIEYSVSTLYLGAKWLCLFGEERSEVPERDLPSRSPPVNAAVPLLLR